MNLVSRATALLAQDSPSSDDLAAMEEQQPGSLQEALEGMAIDQTGELLTPNPSQDALVDKEVLRRWSVPSDALSKPPDLQHLMDTVRLAVRRKQPLRPIGSAHAQSDVSDPPQDNGLLSLGLLGDKLIVDKEVLRNPADADTLYRCEAGRNIGLIIKDLDEQGLALASMGAGNFHGVVGAIQTATHGSGGGLPCLADVVEAMTVVMVEDGVVKALRLERGGDRALSDPARFATANLRQRVPLELRQDDDLFNAVVVSLGCMGVVYSVTIRAVPQYWLHETRTLEWWSDLAPKLLDEVAAYRNFEVLVDPFVRDNGGTPDHQVLVTRRGLVDDHVDSGARPATMALAKTDAGFATYLDRFVTRSAAAE